MNKIDIKYDIHNLISIDNGSYGEVFKFKNRLGHDIVIKNIEYDIFEDLNIKVMSLPSFREISFLTYLDHKHIIYPIYINSEKIYMNYAGHSLSKLIKQYNKLDKRFDESHIKKIFYQLLLSLNYIHKKKIIHCDIKPSNILIYNNKYIRLCDFNISSIDIGNNKLKGDVYTPYYRPLEAYNYIYNEKSDIWALGCTIYEMYYLEHLLGNINTYKIDTNRSLLITKIIQKLGIPDNDIIERYKLNKIIENSDNTINIDYKDNIRTKLDNIGLLGNIINNMLNYDYTKRPSAEELLRNSYFDDIRIENEIHTVEQKFTYHYQYNFVLIDNIKQSKGMNDIIITLAKNLLGYLIKNKQIEYNEIHEWIILVIISTLSDNEQLDFYNDAPYYIKNEVDNIDYGKVLQKILYICNYNIIIP